MKALHEESFVVQQIPGTMQMLSVYSSLCNKLLLYKERMGLAGTYKDAI